jgi:plasmid replication initiation protein
MNDGREIFQPDLFLDQLTDVSPIKGERASMEFPFFSLEKGRRMDPMVYADDYVTIRIEPSTKGMATIWDKDILMYVISLINEKLERGEEVDRTVTFAAWDFLKVTGRHKGKTEYERFMDALERLDGTRIRTNIEAGGDRERRGFGWIESWRVIEQGRPDGSKRMVGVSITLNQWMFRAVVQERRVLTVNRAYFRLTMGLERRMYELARKHCGGQPEWFVSLKRLHQKSGSRREFRKFKADIVKIIGRDSIPDYRLALVDPAEAATPFKPKDGGLLVRVTPREIEPAAPAEPAVAESVTRKTGGVGQSDLLLKTATVEEARSILPGYDVYYVENAWKDWTRKRGEVIDNPDRAFLGFCRSYKDRNPL